MILRTQIRFESDTEVEKRELEHFGVQLPRMGETGHITYLGQDHKYRLQEQGRFELVPQPKETSCDIGNETWFSNEEAKVANERVNRVRWISGL